MRTIKFRGKRINRKGEWSYGDLRQNDHTCWVFPCDDTAACDRDLVDPETVGQYTGLKDKNGKDIYEGDIIGCHNPEIKHLIFYNEKEGRFKAALDGDIESYCIGVCGLDNGDWMATKEVIGNIYDNQELLNNL